MARRARGTDSNPQGRFERLRYDASLASEPPPALDPEDELAPDPRTLLLRDPSRTIVARNDSPDVGFEASINPYRGCEHGCVYCLAPETPVLHADMTWRPLGDVRQGDVLAGFEEEPADGISRHLAPAVVQAVWCSRKATERLVTSQSQVVTTAEHRWLGGQDGRWYRTEQLERGAHPAAPADSRLGVRRRVRLPRPWRPIEPAGMRDVVDIQTSTGTFFAAGLATHNCYARPTHEYLGWSAGLDFETKILVKEEAPALLRKALSSPRWKPTPLALSGVTDAYQPAERKLGVTRRCLEVLVEFRNPVLVITKSWTVTRDADLLAELARHGAASVALSITSLDAELQRTLEPRAAPPKLRLAAIERLAQAGVPVGVMVAPIVPGLTDHEIPRILEAAAAAGAGFAGRVMLRLPHGVKELFSEWLERHFPERREKVLNRLRSLHGGALYDSGFGHRQRGSGVYAEQIARALRRFAPPRRPGAAGTRALERGVPPPRSAARALRLGERPETRIRAHGCSHSAAGVSGHRGSPVSEVTRRESSADSGAGGTSIEHRAVRARK